ncbi:ergosterol biosynthesis protein [Tulasnella sp. 403]|nr:ergosterol biosynthesis protein [Tulasnella sp. 403]
MPSTLAQLLPVADGFLPYWQLFIAAVAALNSFQNMFTVDITKKLYAKKPGQVTPLQARTSTMWNFTAAVVRFHCAYNIHNKAVYDMTLWTYAIAFFHFSSELLLFRTSNLNAALISPVIVSSTSLLWMLKQYDFYVR